MDTLRPLILLPIFPTKIAEGIWTRSIPESWLGTRLEGEALFATAGIWRETDEWGEAFSMIMTDANDRVAPVHNRMPVILPRESWGTWLSGTPREAFGLCVPYAGPLVVDRTDQPWFKPRGK